jgi:hypothetical protein
MWFGWCGWVSGKERISEGEEGREEEGGEEGKDKRREE